VTGTGPDPQQPASGTSASGGHRRTAYLLLSRTRDDEVGPSEDGPRESGQHGAADLAQAVARKARRDFAESQRDGLAAAMGLAQADAAGPAITEPASTEPPVVAMPEPPSAAATSPGPTYVPYRQAPVPDSSVTESDRPAIVGSPAPVIDGGPSPAKTKQERKRGPSWNSGLACVELPLLIAILTMQAILSLRLVWSNTAFHSEAIDLSAGHVEIQSLLHGTPLPAYATYFSGSPVIYPPIGAIANSIGGLAGARILSLLFMLAATSLLWGLTSRLFGRKAGVCAAALFAVLGPTLELGALATFDAMALFLVAASGWCIVAARSRDDSTLLLVGGTILLAVANATSYATILFDAPVIALAGLAVAAKGGKKAAAARSGYVAAGTIGLVSLLLAIGGPSYLAGVVATITLRGPADQSARLVLMHAWKFGGLLLVIAAAGLILCALWRRGRVQMAMLAILVFAGILAPLDQAILHNTTSLSIHVDFGSWFVAAGAGCAITQLSEIGRWRALQLAVAGLALVAVALPFGMRGNAQASKSFEAWPDSERMTADLLSLTRSHPGRYLAEDDSIPAYYLENTVSWQRWSGTTYFSYKPPGFRISLTGLPAYRAAIARHYFSLIIFDFEETARTDDAIFSEMQQVGGYKEVALAPSSVGEYTIWAYEPARPSGGGDHGHR
jgi:hypothetical protein